jgi:monoamine oxidase
LNNPVSRVAWGGKSGISVETPMGKIEARAAIVTASPGVLADEGIRFDPALPDWKRQAIADLPMGHCNKVILNFARNVFGDLQSVLLTPDRGAGEAVEFVLGEDNRNVAVCMFNGPFARDIAKAGAGAMRAYALERLGEIFGSDVARQTTRQTLVADWDADSFTRGSFVAARPGRADSRVDLKRPVEDRLFFAGEATSVEYAGDVHGAYLSGIDAAEAAIATVRR